MSHIVVRDNVFYGGIY